MNVGREQGSPGVCPSGGGPAVPGWGVRGTLQNRRAAFAVSHRLGGEDPALTSQSLRW
ncbi:MAG: hypothetical protein AVDCRST_MAG19-3149 [uncultured Thermomicrobiales bacterium]|uniref:Uncharacterized protein n=1 Tax=uncultured Thermomicrobiales bacterium TaxID=1645740 RepID=A0A6J4VDH1_9BACT|nr:MAG: hypothetical protein AVDCRST_MAG19-3149 [uncultured Thermomicrobiales bacterium]